jgi:DNA-binding protein HU-beta
MVNSATREWSEISLRCQVSRARPLEKTLIFLFFSLAPRAYWIFTRLKSGYIFGLNKQTNNNTTNKTNMAKALSKAQIASLVAEKNGLSKKQAVEILDCIAALAYKHAKDTFTLPGIGKLVLKNRAARMGRNPKTGEAIQIKAKRVVKFRVAKAAKDAILGTK